MTLPAVLVLAVGTYLLKAVGPVLAGGRSLPRRLESLVSVLPPALLAALVAVQTFEGADGISVDARVPALLVAAVAVALRAPFIAVVVAAAVTAAVLRALGWG